MNGFPSVCSVEQANFRGWEAVYLRNGLVTLVAVPDIGGRVMAFDLNDYSFLFVDPELAGKLFSPDEHQGDGSLAAWKNYGGDKTWPSPQGWDTDEQWHGPPDPVLDGGRYSLEELGVDHGAAHVTMVSPPDPRSGLQITRRLSLFPESTRLALDLAFTNISQRRLRWSIWDVVQLRAERSLPDGGLSYEPGCVITAPLNPHSRFLEGYQVMFGAQDNPQWTVDAGQGLFYGRYGWEIGKVGLDSPGGWIAFTNTAAGMAFAEHFAYQPDGQYPDGGSTIECWTVGKGQVGNLDYEHCDIFLMETEVLSPLMDFAPGERREFSIVWGACRCNGVVIDVNSAGCVVEPLRLAREYSGVFRIAGSFGVFDAGQLLGIWKDGDGRFLERLHLGQVNPWEAVLLDALHSGPTAARLFELEVHSSHGAHRLASVTL